jgi:hypothetical protein
MDHSKELSELLDATVPGHLDPIFLRIGKEEMPDATDPSSMDCGPGDISIAITFGRMWWDERRPQVQKLVCGNERIRGLVKGEERELASNIFELLIGVFVPAIASKLSVLAVRTGIASLCKGQWQEKNNGS